MGWRFRKSFTVIPGLKLNLSKSGLSASIGGAPFTLNVGPRGAMGGAGVPDAVVASSCRILIETKLVRNTVNLDQLKRHLIRLDSATEGFRCLLVLTPDENRPTERGPHR
jgi:hypothetical protein